MGLERYWDVETVASNLFRIVAWLFLRVIPSNYLQVAVPVCYALYLGIWIASFHSKRNTKADTPQSTSLGLVKPDEDSLANGDTKPTSLPQLPHGTLSTIVLSLPTSSFTLRSIVLLINTLLLFCTGDLLTRPTREPALDVKFTRLGAVDPDGAKVVVRWPEFEEGAIRILWRQAASGTSELDRAWKNGPLVPVRNETDWVGVGRIAGLWPSTAYEYSLAYPNSTRLPYPHNPILFRTFPDPRLTTGNKFKFIASSCIMPNFPYRPFQGERIKGFDLLADYVWPGSIAPSVTTQPAASVTISVSGFEEPLVSPVTSQSMSTRSVEETFPEASGIQATAMNESTPASPPISGLSETAANELEPIEPPTEFLLLLGDFIYADLPWYRGDDLEAYRRLYRRMYASPSFRKVYERLPIFNIYDDHDIINAFEGQSNKSAEPFRNASSAYYTYNGQANYAPTAKGEHYFDFRYGDVAFFILDTRLHRSSHVSTELETKTMLGEQQLLALHEWLDKVNATTTFKFIISSVPFTSLWGHNAQVDSWAGYLHERDALLTVLGTVPNVFVISGDRHEFAAIEYLGGKVVEFSTSPLSMFYIPIIRTLRNHSKRFAEKRVMRVEIDENGKELVQEHTVLVPEEQVIKYLPLGNYKWSTFEIDTTDREHPTLKLEVVINGHPEWRHTIVGQPVPLRASRALGTQITRGLKDAIGKFGLSPMKWF